MWPNHLSDTVNTLEECVFTTPMSNSSVCANVNCLFSYNFLVTGIFFYLCNALIGKIRYLHGDIQCIARTKILMPNESFSWPQLCIQPFSYYNNSHVHHYGFNWSVLFQLYASQLNEGDLMLQNLLQTCFLLFC